MLALVRKGIKMIILTNSLAANDVSVVHAGYAKWRKNLLRHDKNWRLERHDGLSEIQHSGMGPDFTFMVSAGATDPNPDRFLAVSSSAQR